MKLANWLRIVMVGLAVVMSSCASTSFKEDALALSTEQATVFGRVTLVRDGRKEAMNVLGTSNLWLVIRGENNAEASLYAIRDPGYFFWNLPPGKYMIVGYAYGLQHGSVRMEFTISPGPKSLYVGDLTINVQGSYYQVDHGDNFAAGVETFRKKFPGSRIEPERADAKMEKPPGSYGSVTWICGPEWGLDCKGGAAGVTPIYPDERSRLVDSLAPTLKWTPSPRSDVAYDVVVYEEVKFPRNQVGAILDSLPGRQIFYAEGTHNLTIRLDPPLRPGGSYLWSVRLRRGETVSTWSTFGYFQFFLVGWYSARGQWFSFSTPAK